MSDKIIATKCEKCGGLKAGDLHQFPSCAAEIITEQQAEIERLNARLKYLQDSVCILYPIDDEVICVYDDDVRAALFGEEK